MSTSTADLLLAFIRKNGLLQVAPEPNELLTPALDNISQ